MKSKIFWILLWLLLGPLLAHAQELAPFQEKFYFQMGYFLPEFDSNTRVDNRLIERGTDLHLEDRLGLNKTQTLLWGSVTWRMAQNHRLQVGIFDFNRHGDRTINEELHIGDKVYPIGAEINTDLKFRVIPINYLYSFTQDSQFEFAGYVGLQWSQINFNVAGSITTNPADFNKSAKADADGPLPVVGVDGHYYFTPQWSVGGNLGAFIFKIKSPGMYYQGTVTTATIDGGYWFSNYVGVGLAVNYFKFDVDVTKDSWDGAFMYQYWGPQIYLTGRF
jgi:hypothetical protein